MRFGDASGDGADPDFRNELNADAGRPIRVFQIVNQFGQILDGVDVVVRGRGDKTDARGGVTHLGDGRVDLAAGKLTAFARLRALGHLDLEFLGVGQVEARDAETAGSDLLDGGILGVTLFVGPGVALRIFAAFARVGFTAETVHRDRESLVGLGRNGAIAHRAGLEAFEDIFEGLDFFDRDGLLGFELKQPAQREDLLHLVVDQSGVGLKGVVVVRADGLLERVDNLRTEKVAFAFVAPLVIAADFQSRRMFHALREGAAVAFQGFFSDGVQVGAFDAGRRTGEVFINDFLLQTDAFEDLGAEVALNRRDANLGGDFNDTLGRGLYVILASRVVVDADQQTLTDHIVEGFEGQVRIDTGATVAD